MSALVARALEREMLVYARTWRGSVFSAFVQPLLFLGAMGIGLGGLIDDGGAGVGTGDMDYLLFVTPGLLCASSLLAAAGDNLWGVMAGVKWMGQYNSMVSTSMVPGDVYGGKILSAGVRTAIAATVFLAVATVLGGVASWLAPLALVPTVLIGMVAAAWLSAFAVRREDDSTFPLIMRLGIIPLFLFSGTFFPVDQLPDAVQPVIWLSPLWHAVEPARDLTAGGAGAGTALHVLILVALLVIAVPIGVRGFTERLTP